MDSWASWSCLPDELVLNILARLPLIHYEKVRTVCKRWNELASDGGLLSLRAKLSRSRPGFALFLTSEEKSEMRYLDLNDSCKWRSISFSFMACSGALKFLASSGGMLLLGQRNKQSQQEGGNLLVVNPISRMCKRLPPHLLIRDPFYTALWSDPTSGQFVVVIADSELRENPSTEIFDSHVGHWSLSPSPSRAGHWKRIASTMSTPWFYGSIPVYCQPVFCSDAFYHMTWDPEDMVAEFSLPFATWRCTKGTGAVPDGVPWGVMEAHGKVTLVEMSYPKGGTDVATLSLWELHRAGLQWVHTARVPAPPNPELRVDRWRRFAVGDGFVCATFLLPGSIVTFSNQVDAQRGMIYDVARASWLPMPDLPGTPWGNISSLFSFNAVMQATATTSL